MPTPPLHLSIASDVSCIAAADEAVRELAQTLGFAEDDAHELTLAVHEALANAVIHGKPRGGAGAPSAEARVELTVRVARGGVIVEVRDRGPGFDPAAVPSPIAEENLLRPSGRGLFTMRTYMDEVAHSAHPDGGTVVRMTRLRHQREGDVMAQLTIQQREVRGVTVLDLTGKISIGEGAAQLRDAVRALLTAEGPKILLHCAAVTYLDSAGLGELVGAYTAANNRGGRLKLLHLPAKLRDLLTITSLITVFESFDDEQEAVDSFR